MNLKDLKSYGNKVITRTQECYSVFKDHVESYYLENSTEDQDLKDTLTERSLTHLLLRISVFAFASKAIFQLAQRGWLTPVLTVLSTIVSIPVLLWTNIWGSYGLVFPVLSGIAMTVITWYTVFLDSYIPGVFPVSPSSPKKNRLYPSHFHLGYIVALANGVFLALLMYLG